MADSYGLVIFGTLLPKKNGQGTSEALTLALPAAWENIKRMMPCLELLEREGESEMGYSRGPGLEP